MSYLIKGTSKLTSAELAAKADFIVERMTGNAAFPDAASLLTAITAATATLRAAMRDALDGGRTATAIPAARHKERRLLRNPLSGHVASVAEGNELAILRAGFG
ncbi:MAG: hypothetical protein ACK6A5_15105, partial [Flavobacteriales bacterium]